MSLVHIRADIHVVRETEASRMFRRLLNFPDIFTYWNAETGQWVLGYWINRMSSLADEIEDLGAGMECLTSEMVSQIVNCWKPVDWAKKKRNILAREQRFIKRKNEEITEENEKWKWLKKRIGDKAPVPYAFNPKLSGGEVGAPNFNP